MVKSWKSPSFGFKKDEHGQWRKAKWTLIRLYSTGNPELIGPHGELQVWEKWSWAFVDYDTDDDPDIDDGHVSSDSSEAEKFKEMR